MEKDLFLEANDNPYRHPGGRTCQASIPLALLLMPRALFLLWRDRRTQNRVCRGC